MWRDAGYIGGAPINAGSDILSPGDASHLDCRVKGGSDTRSTVAAEGGAASAVPPGELSWACDPATLGFETTETVRPVPGLIGQERADRALELGLDIESEGFNVFVSGASGTGRTSAVRRMLEALAPERPKPDDLCYVTNFADPSRPQALTLPAGSASLLKRDVDELVAAVKRELLRAFDSPEVEQRRAALASEMQTARETVVNRVEETASAKGFALQMGPQGFGIAPVAKGTALTPEQFQQLDEETKTRIRHDSETLAEEARHGYQEIARIERESQSKMESLEREVAHVSVQPLFAQLLSRYQEHRRVVEFLESLREDIVGRQAQLRQPPGDEESSALAGLAGPAPPLEAAYGVNVVVDNADLHGAPVVFEANPTYYNLVGRVEYHMQFGALITDYRMVTAGALHRANGGFLVLQALDVFASPFAWDALKRTLRTGAIQMENLGEQLNMVPTSTLRPQPTPAAVKVVLVGSLELYYRLYFYDEDFRRLFKIRADFDTEMARTPESIGLYAAFVAGEVQGDRLPQFTAGAVGRLAEYGARLAGHQEKLSTRFRDIGDVAAEAAHVTRKRGQPMVTADAVQEAISQRIYRSGLFQQKMREATLEGTVVIATEGAHEGQVNGLTVMSLGDNSFGHPVRVTAQVAVGSEGIVDVQRDAHLSGPIHNKAFQILTGFLTARFAQTRPMAMSARVSFEQVYDEIEGDSASSTELYALLSRLSGLPLRQDIAVTGSVNQYGEVQAIGGVNEKIEGFFDICRSRGLTGTQGVMIPATNRIHLMLREDVVEAVAAKKFHIWTVKHTDEGIELLTGVPAGRQDEAGTWTAGSVYARVDEQLTRYADALHSFGGRGNGYPRPERTPAKIGPQTPRVQGPGA